ncbi:hypothetical protein CSA08_01975 [Candidatus Gracilibacteria bacterium]|nr:MAG: hypothetical protein CSA08_01975 [Candidatus Gracilibacteria bacterium]
MIYYEKLSKEYQERGAKILLRIKTKLTHKSIPKLIDALEEMEKKYKNISPEFTNYIKYIKISSIIIKIEKDESRPILPTEGRIAKRYIYEVALAKELLKDNMLFSTIQTSSHARFISILIEEEGDIEVVRSIKEIEEIITDYYKATEQSSASKKFDKSVIALGKNINLGGIKGTKQALKDYLEEWKSLATPSEYYELLLAIVSVPSKINNGDYSLEKIKKEAVELYEIGKNIDEIVEGLPEDKKLYYKAYITTSVELAFIPIKINKFNKLKGRGDSKVMREIKDLKKKKLPDYIKSDRKIIIDDTFLKGNSNFKGTTIKVKGAKVFQDINTNYYYHIDTAHKGKSAHLEVYNKNKKHIGECDPVTGKIDYNKADKNKTLPKG